MEERRASEFASQIYEWNKTQNYIYTMVLIVPAAFIAILVNVVSVDYMNLLKPGSNLLWVVGILLFIGIYFSISFCKLHVFVAGKDGKLRQSIVDVISYQPFSIETYFRVLKRKCIADGVILYCVVTLVVITGAFFRVDVKETDRDTIYALQQVTERKALLYMLAVVILAVVILTVTIMIVFQSYQKQLQTQLENLKRGDKAKRMEQTKARNKAWSARNSVLLFVSSVIIGVITLFMIEVIREMLLPQDFSQEWLHNMHTNVTGSIGSVLVFFVYSSITENRKSIKKTVVICVLIYVVMVGYMATFYNCYYEDYFEVHTFLNDKTYAWSDVKGYKVSGSSGRGSVQLELQMEDDNVKVFVGETTTSDKHAEQYLTDYHYVLALMEKMDSYGIPGEIRNYDKLKKYADEWWEEERAEVQAALEEMKKIVKPTKKKILPADVTDEIENGIISA